MFPFSGAVGPSGPGQVAVAAVVMPMCRRPAGRRADGGAVDRRGRRGRQGRRDRGVGGRCVGALCVGGRGDPEVGFEGGQRLALLEQRDLPFERLQLGVRGGRLQARLGDLLAFELELAGEHREALVERRGAQRGGSRDDLARALQAEGDGVGERAGGFSRRGGPRGGSDAQRLERAAR